MADTSVRTLRLLSLLQARRHWRGADLAGRLEVSLRTLRRDVDRLRALGYPVEAHPGVDGGYALAPGASLPPLVLDDDEAVAITVGLSAAAAAGVAGLAEPAVQALAKVVPVMPARLRRRAEALRTATVQGSWGASGASGDDGVDPEALTAVALACRDGVRLDFTYVAADGAGSVRHVEPHRVVALDRRWYLVAWDLDRVDWRVFRLDRLGDPRATGARVAPRRLPDDAATFVRARLSGGPERHRVEAVVDAPAAEVRGRFRWWLSVEPKGEGRCRVRLDVDDLLWAATALGLVGAPFTVVTPPELRRTLRDVAQRYVRAGEQPD